MKKMVPVFILFAMLSGCASIQQKQHYSDIAKGNSFSYFFPSNSSTRAFSTLEEASDFVNAADIKLGISTNKKPAKGLSRKANWSKCEK